KEKDVAEDLEIPPRHSGQCAPKRHGSALSRLADGIDHGAVDEWRQQEVDKKTDGEDDQRGHQAVEIECLPWVERLEEAVEEREEAVCLQPCDRHGEDQRDAREEEKVAAVDAKRFVEHVADLQRAQA